MGTFDAEEFRYLGRTAPSGQEGYELALVTTRSGEACETSRRLLLFDGAGTYLGRYDALREGPSGMVGAMVLFPFDAASGNLIRLDGVLPPHRVWLGGELYVFQSANWP